MVVADLASMHTTSLLVYHGEKANKQDGTVRIMPSCRVRVWATRQRAHILHLCTAVDLSLACVVQCKWTMVSTSITSVPWSLSRIAVEMMESGESTLSFQYLATNANVANARPGDGRISSPSTAGRDPSAN